MEREAYRAFHSVDRVHKADHFLNFCVTAHSMRDYWLEHARISRVEQEPFHVAWNEQAYLLAAAEIANMSKHFQLRVRRTGVTRTPRTRSVAVTGGEFVDIYENWPHGMIFVRRVAPDVVVTVSDGSKYALHEFTHAVLEYWRTFLRENGIRVRRHSVAELIGQSTFDGRDPRRQSLEAIE